MGWFATLKKIGSKIWGAKSRVQKTKKMQPNLASSLVE
jgi:hypothetical protein